MVSVYCTLVRYSNNMGLFLNNSVLYVPILFYVFDLFLKNRSIFTKGIIKRKKEGSKGNHGFPLLSAG